MDQISTKPSSGTWEGLCGSHGLEGQGYGTSEYGVTDCRTDPPWLLMKMGMQATWGGSEARLAQWPKGKRQLLPLVVCAPVL